MEQTLNYKEGFRSLYHGIKILSILNARWCYKYKLILMLTISILVNLYQASIVTRQRVDRDRDSLSLYKLQHTLDSLQGKQIKYYSYRTK